MSTNKTYNVLQPFTYDRLYEAGEQVDLPDTAASGLLRSKSIEPIEAPKETKSEPKLETKAEPKTKARQHQPQVQSADEPESN